MPAGLLRGRDHIRLGEVALVAEGPAAAALSRGGAPKTYAHRDPNEDATGFLCGGGGALLLVADGHGGSEAAEIALAELLGDLAERWTGPAAPRESWEASARDAIGRAHRAILAGVARGGNAEARTTLSFALVRPDDDLLAWASVGDSHVFRVAGSRALEIGPAGGGVDFLGRPSRDAADLAVRSGRQALAGCRAVVLVTDGLSERGIGVRDPAAAVLAAAERGAAEPRAGRGPLEAARHLIDVALEAHRLQRSGDNVAAALYLAPSP